METEKKGMNSMFLYWATNQWQTNLSGESNRTILGRGYKFILKQLWNISLESFRDVGGISTSWKTGIQFGFIMLPFAFLSFGLFLSYEQIKKIDQKKQNKTETKENKTQDHGTRKFRVMLVSKQSWWWIKMWR